MADNNPADYSKIFTAYPVHSGMFRPFKDNFVTIFSNHNLFQSLGSRDGAVVRALASHQCGPGSIPGPGVICGLSLLLVLVPAPRVFLRVLRFSSLHKNQHFQIPIRSGIRGPQVCQSRDCYVLSSLNIVDLFILFLFLCS